MNGTIENRRAIAGLSGSRPLAAVVVVASCFSVLIGGASSGDKKQRPRCREAGIFPGVLQAGKWNAITDVAGVRVGSVTVWEGKGVRTGVTVVIPHGGDVFQEKVPAGVYVGNGFGKAFGFLQVEELGFLETPIALTNTLNVGLVADALASYVLGLPGNENVRSVNVVVGETNDGYLNEIRRPSVTREHVFEALQKARDGAVEEGSVGAGTGTVCFGYKGGIGTASRVLPESRGGYTVGALVQSNFGGIFTIDGVPVGRELGRYYMQGDLGEAGGSGSGGSHRREGSCMIIVATDAPVSPRNLKRMAKRALLGLARTGGFSSNGSGDFVIAFSTALENRVSYSSKDPTHRFVYLRNDRMSPLFLATVEAVEEAIYNSLFRATTVCGRDGHCVEALPIERVLEICKRYGKARL